MYEAPQTNRKFRLRCLGSGVGMERSAEGWGGVWWDCTPNIHVASTLSNSLCNEPGAQRLGYTPSGICTVWDTPPPRSAVRSCASSVRRPPMQCGDKSRTVWDTPPPRSAVISCPLLTLQQLCHWGLHCLLGFHSPTALPLRIIRSLRILLTSSTAIEDCTALACLC